MEGLEQEKFKSEDSVSDDEADESEEFDVVI